MARRRAGGQLKAGGLLALLDRAFGRLTAASLRGLRRLDRKRSANFAASTMRRIGPLLRENRVAREQIALSFPEKSPAEVEAILQGSWDNLGRVAAEFAHLDRIRTFDPNGAGPFDIEYDEGSLARFTALREGKKAALIFAAHLGNWELPAQIAHTFGLDTVVLYRRPNVGAAADAIVEIREGSMGALMPTSLDAPLKLAKALQAGRHVAMLVDQYDVRGVDVMFFGRQTRANPLIARLARQVDVPIHGVRIMRVPGGRFRAELTDTIVPARDAQGAIDVQGTMQVITGIVEGWVREHPEQWLWAHRRWRPEDPPRVSGRS